MDRPTRIMLAVRVGKAAPGPGRTAAWLASRLGAELMVAGTEARGAIQGMIIGDTTREILRRSPCPVVVVPPQRADRR